MTAEEEIVAEFWKHLRTDRTVMLGLDEGAPTALRPMTAQIDGDADAGPIWFFASSETSFVGKLLKQNVAMFTFASKSHGVFANVHGHIMRSTDRAVIERLWNPWVAAWYEGGQDDPKLALLRFDPARAEIWLDASSLLSGLSVLLGGDPKADYKENVAKVPLN